MAVLAPDASEERPFTTGQEHLCALLGWMRRLLAWQADVTRHSFGGLADDAYRGLYVPDREIDLIGNRWQVEDSQTPELMARRTELEVERSVIEARALAAERTGTQLPFRHVTRLFDLSRREHDVLVLGLAPELDLRIERFYAYVQDDVTRKRPSVDLALRLLTMPGEEMLAERSMFFTTSPLLNHRLIQLLDDGRPATPLLARFIKVDDRVVAELLGQSEHQLDSVIGPFVSLTRPTRSLDGLVLPPEVIGPLRRAVTELGAITSPAEMTRVLHPVADAAQGLVISLRGEYGSGRRAVAEALCAESARSLLTVELERMVESQHDPVEAIDRIVREATLRGAVIYWQGIASLLHQHGANAGDDSPGAALATTSSLNSWRAAVLRGLRALQISSILPLHDAWDQRGLLGAGVRVLHVAFPGTSYADRIQMWRARLDDAWTDTMLQALASTFRLTGGQIRDAMTMARDRAWSVGEPITADDLYEACRAQSSGRLNALAHKIRPTYGWEDIVLPIDQLDQLREIAAQVRHRGTVLEEWGFDAHLAMGKGLNALFAGTSGTGKTMAAEIVAADLGLELYKIDLSSLVSKYIGETEKNLNKIFAAAREASAILFFDEADAIFGKRSEVKDAHDRYANIEVGYLLQKMEEYDGVVILATNLRKNIDEAFVRRLHMAIDFPFPEELDRRRIWAKVFPAATPLAEDVDLAFLAERFKLTGGNIRNVALLAAFLAAEEQRAVGMSQIMRAMKREYQKLGKLLTQSDFGMYLDNLRAREGPA